MDTSIITAIITGVLALVGVIITNIMGNTKIEQSLEKAQAVTDVKIDHLTEEVKKHNEFSVRIPVIESKMSDLETRVGKLEEK